MLGFDFASPNLRATSDKVWPQFDDQPVCHSPQNRAGNTRPVLSNLPVIAQIEATVQIAKVIAASLPGNLSTNAPLLIDICLQTHFQLRTVSRKILFHRSIIKRYRHIIAGVQPVSFSKRLDNRTAAFVQLPPSPPSSGGVAGNDQLIGRRIIGAQDGIQVKRAAVAGFIAQYAGDFKTVACAQGKRAVCWRR